MGVHKTRPYTSDMDLDGIIRELLDERKRLDRMIRALENQGPGGSSPRRSKGRQGRKSMDGAARQQVSERMKQYWAKRREQGIDAAQDFGSAGEPEANAA
jgi:hypothetical protein